MNAGKRQCLRFWRGSYNLRVSFTPNPSPTELKLLVKQQVAAGFPLLHCKGDERMIVLVELHHTLEVDGAHHVDVMEKKRFLFRLGGRSRMVKKKPASLFQAATGIEQHVLARHFDAHAKISSLFEEGGYLVCEVVHVDDHVVDSESTQASEGNFQRRAPADFHQRFWAVIGERPQACT